ncbi:hypothetical protein B7C42_07000 [Nocardia cerradoensis]|uniref:Uncharacterized protein n=1 Tax=Nocardia cerradoensis TaxID=85688 RepID=A0A231GWB5_9NOCA|nr:YhjD/YihY/BrkB family envelope integrity protein [Nocardia cerradoensis]OXR40865.1 hypothetical protein B7C42_07000 [Nocardia cerradoensis]
MEQRAPDAPTELPSRAWRAVLRNSLREFKNDELADRAAALTYYGVLALFPALLVLVSLLGIAGGSATARVMDNLRRLAPGSTRDLLVQAVEQLQGRSGLGSVRCRRAGSRLRRGLAWNEVPESCAAVVGSGADAIRPSVPILPV